MERLFCAYFFILLRFYSTDILSATINLYSARSSTLPSNGLEYVYSRLYSPGISHLYIHVFVSGAPTVAKPSVPPVSVLTSSRMTLSSPSTLHAYPVEAFSSRTTRNGSPLCTMNVLFSSSVTFGSDISSVPFSVVLKSRPRHSKNSPGT